MSKQGRLDRQRRELMRLQAAVAEQMAERAKQYLPPDDGPGAERVKPVVGMPADVVLVLPGYGKVAHIAPAQGGQGGLARQPRGVRRAGGEER